MDDTKVPRRPNKYRIEGAPEKFEAIMTHNWGWKWEFLVAPPRMPTPGTPQHFPKEDQALEALRDWLRVYARDRRP